MYDQSIVFWVSVNKPKSPFITINTKQLVPTFCTIFILGQLTSLRHHLHKDLNILKDGVL